MFRVGVIGYGYWGPNIVRNFQAQSRSQVQLICDKRADALQTARRDFREIRVTTEPNEVLRSPDIDIVAVVTPVWTHYELAKAALQNGKHVFVEKPFTADAIQALELIELAERKRLKIMVDHTFLFTGAVRKIRQLIDEGILGNIYYYDSTRINLGLFQHDVNVIWDLAPHDLAIMNYLLQAEPEALVATGQTHVNNHEDIAFLTVYYPRKMIGHVNVNWLSPVKIRTTMIGGEKKMLVWDDMEPDEKIKVYDKGVEVTTRAGLYEVLVRYRLGDMWAPHVEHGEALRAELSYFLDVIEHHAPAINDGVAGLWVVRMLEAAEQSLKRRGEVVSLVSGERAAATAA